MRNRISERLLKREKEQQKAKKAAQQQSSTDPIQPALVNNDSQENDEWSDCGYNYGDDADSFPHFQQETVREIPFILPPVECVKKSRK
ncbi:hypothetical protein MAM1_0256c08805 [Mucor ambiguus]|uniref:Uncharacterized protein n=1 Tax=Mucor ambiguus TaxID=91626 RepID=A0A0C9LWX4_9FUNG|nr:hypothetical protein MAM1_0256c08805 [Mucor ambiguus]